MRDADMCECCSKERFNLSGFKQLISGNKYMGCATVINRDGKHKIVAELAKYIEEDDAWMPEIIFDGRKESEIKYCPMCGRKLSEEETGEEDDARLYFTWTFVMELDNRHKLGIIRNSKNVYSSFELIKELALRNIESENDERFVIEVIEENYHKAREIAYGKVYEYINEWC